MGAYLDTPPSFMFGADPEVFVFGPDDRPVPAHRLGFPSKYETPLQRGPGVAFRDGYVIEFNFPPQPTPRLMLQAAKDVWAATQAQLPDGYKLRAVPAAEIRRDDLTDAPYDVLEFGCDPSRSAYGDLNRAHRPDAYNHLWRYAGGHIHVSSTPNLPWLTSARRLAAVVRAIDFATHVLLLQTPECQARRVYYGRAGEHRLQVYSDGNLGLEYRVPGSNDFFQDDRGEIIAGRIQSVLSQRINSVVQRFKLDSEYTHLAIRAIDAPTIASWRTRL